MNELPKFKDTPEYQEKLAQYQRSVMYTINKYNGLLIQASGLDELFDIQYRLKDNLNTLEYNFRQHIVARGIEFDLSHLKLTDEPNNPETV